MRKILGLSGITMFFLLTLAILSLNAADETLTITTYNPTPQGSFNNLDVKGNLTVGGTAGIGTTAPSEKVEISGNLAFSKGASRTIKIPNGGDSAGNDLTISAGDSQEASAGKLTLKGGYTSGEGPTYGGKVELAGGSQGGNGGNVYISGGNAPDYGGDIYIYGGDGDVDMDGNVLLAYNGTTAFGKVGIGTASPLSKLTVGGPGSDYPNGISGVGVYGQAFALGGTGVFGYNNYLDGYGVRGYDNGVGKAGVYGYQGGNGYGVEGEGFSTGVYGKCTSNYTDSSHGIGVYGYSQFNIGIKASGARYDLYADTASAKNYFAGNVGIGTTNPASKLTVNGDILLTKDANRTISVENANQDGVWGKNLTIKAGDNTASCFSADTKIETPAGAKLISGLKIGDPVTSFDVNKKITREAKVIKIFSRQVKQYYILQLDSNRTIKTTAEHPFYTKKGWVTVKDLSLEDELFSGSRWVKIISKKLIKEKLLVYNLRIGKPNTFFAEGVLVHNKVGDGPAGNLYLSAGIGQLGIYGNIYIANSGGNVGIGRNPSTNKLEVEGNASKTAAGSWLANSDKRIKTDIGDIDNAVRTLGLLRPVRFKYTDEYRARHPSIKDKYYYNFIAQEFQQVFPSEVTVTNDKLPDGERILAIDPYVVTPYLVKAIQEMKAENDLLKARVEALERNLRRSRNR